MIQQRLIGLDNLRVFLVLMGIFFHAVLFLAFRLNNLEIDLPSLAQLTALLTHSAAGLLLGLFSFYLYWMPAFFLLAGFFARFAYQQHGLKAFFFNRLRRIGGPLLFCTLWIVPFYWLIDGLSRCFSSLAPFVMALHSAYLKDGGVLGLLNHLGNTWFLYDLLLFYGLTIICIGLQRYFLFLQTWFHMIDGILTQVFIRQWHYVLFAIASILLMFKSVFLGYTSLDITLKPNMGLLGFYSLWYAVGWWLWSHQEQFSHFFKHSLKIFASSMVLYGIFLLCYYPVVAIGHSYLKSIALVIYQLSLSFSVFSIFGIALHYAKRQHKIVRYLSGASYWLYLTQITFIAGLMVLTVKSPAYFFQQSVWISLATIGLSLLSYHFLVRPTWLNRFVGGK